jgi:hypothetical protein
MLKVEDEKEKETEGKKRCKGSQRTTRVKRRWCYEGFISFEASIWREEEL